MNCKKVKVLLSSYVDNEISESEKLILVTHLERCLQCQQELKQLKHLKKILTISINPKPIPFFTARLLKRIYQEKENFFTPDFILLAKKALILGAGCLILVIALILSGVGYPKNISVDYYLFPELINNQIRENNFHPGEKFSREDVINLAYSNLGGN